MEHPCYETRLGSLQRIALLHIKLDLECSPLVRRAYRPAPRFPISNGITAEARIPVCSFQGLTGGACESDSPLQQSGPFIKVIVDREANVLVIALARLLVLLQEAGGHPCQDTRLCTDAILGR